MSRSKKRSKGAHPKNKSKSFRKKEKAMVEKSLQLLNEHLPVFRATAQFSLQKEETPNYSEEIPVDKPDPVQSVPIEKFPERLLDETTEALSACKYI